MNRTKERVVSAAWFLVLVLSSCQLLEPSPYSLRAFDRPDWLGRVDRYEMLNDLEARHLHPGLTKDEAKALLGTPESSSAGVWYYTCGCPPNGWAIDPVILHLRWSGDRLTAWRVVGG